jgi:hypothetical protein
MKMDRGKHKSTHQKLSNTLREGERIVDRYHLANLARWAAFCAERMTYREIANMAGKSAGWWKLASDRQWQRIKPTLTEYRAIKLLHDVVAKFGGDTSGRRELAYRILGDLGNLQRHIAELMRKA